jgi:hypothetical protein
MALPLLLMLMALIVVFGTAASWKVRTEVVSRDAMWRARSPRQGHELPRPAAWPSSADMGVRGNAPIPAIDDPALRQPVARGPLPGGVSVNSALLNYARGAAAGTADITRNPPMLDKLGPYRFHVENPILEDRFQFGEMGLGGNRQRRLPVIYELPRAPQALEQAYVRAVVAIETSPVQVLLRPLDRDEEFLAFYRWAPDFHPRVQSFATLDVEWVEKNRVRPVVRQIENLPQRMASAFVGLYEAMLRTEPPPSPAVEEELRRRIDALRGYISELNRRRRGGSLADAAQPGALSRD